MPQLCQERDGHRLKAVLHSGAESASGSVRDVEALRVACVMRRNRVINESGTAKSISPLMPAGMGGVLLLHIFIL